MKPKLLIDNGGQIACEEHAPHRGSDSRYTGQWRPMRVDERADFEAELGYPARCETCAAIERKTRRVTP